ncbi:MAG TPA: Xaa-Pro peptidase family protein [Mycobacteriales bacterium]|nr:Xaa-Pro peptidase family protein [Mycobacteriales bacterium]
MARHDAVAACLPDDVDALLVTRPENVRYLSGFTGSNGALLLQRDTAPVLATDARYVLQAAHEAPGLEVLEASRVGPALLERAAVDGVGRLGFEAHQVTVESLGQLEAVAAGRFELVAAGKPVEEQRAVKDPDEVEALRRACGATDRAFETVLGRLAAGITEREAEWELINAMREAGAEGPSFPSIVAFGPDAAIPHHRPSHRTLAPGDLVKLDFGALIDGYHADMTRTIVFGRPAGWQRELHDEVKAIQAELASLVAPGVVPADLDAEMRTRIAASGHEVAHGLGHGVGLEIHEDPFLTERSPASPLVPGMVVTIEPGIYLAGRGGVRIEDCVLVTEVGGESLTTSPRELIEL